MILENPIFTEMILPFMLVFVVVFAILQRSKILGENKEQIDAIVALVIGLLLIVVPPARNIVVGIMPWLAVGVAVILVFLILYGFVAGDLTKDDWMKNSAKNIFLALSAVFTLVVVLYISGLWEILYRWYSNNSGGDFWVSAIMIVVIVGVVVLAVKSSKKGGGDKE